MGRRLPADQPHDRPPDGLPAGLRALRDRAVGAVKAGDRRDHGRPHRSHTAYRGITAGSGFFVSGSVTFFTLAAAPPAASGQSSWTAGPSERGEDIRALRWNDRSGPPILVFGGIHGDERSAGDVAMLLERRWLEDASLLRGAHVVLITIVNPDGWAAGTRKNANGVDLNRNFPDGWETSAPGAATHGGPRALSESEARVLRDFVVDEGPRAIMSIHSCRTCGGVNNYDGPAQSAAEAMTAVNGYRALAEWDQRTPGSFGTFAGKSRHIPTLTLEIPRDVSGPDELDRNARAIETFVRAVSGP